MLAVVGTLVLTALLSTACGADVVIEPLDVAVVSSQVTETPVGATDDIDQNDQIGGIDLDTILLRSTDLPDGWEELPTASDEGGSCLDALFGVGRPLDPQVAKTATFGASDSGPFIVAWVVGEPHSDVLVAINDVVVACDGATAPSGFTTTIDATPVSGLPDDSLSIHGADVNAGGARIEFTLAGAGSDLATAVVFAATPLGEIDDALIASGVNAMVGRIPPS